MAPGPDYPIPILQNTKRSLLLNYFCFEKNVFENVKWNNSNIYFTFEFYIFNFFNNIFIIGPLQPDALFMQIASKCFIEKGCGWTRVDTLVHYSIITQKHVQFLKTFVSYKWLSTTCQWLLRQAALPYL